MSAASWLLLSVLAASPAAGEARFVPSFGLTVGSYGERLEVGAGAEARGLMTSGVELGLHYRLYDRLPMRLGLDGVTTLGVATVFARGQFPLVLGQQVRLTREWDWFGVFFGLGAGLSVNVSDPTFSFFAVDVPLGVRLGPVDVVYAPRLVVPLAEDSSDVFAGERRHSVALAFEPLMVAVRVRFAALGF